MDRKMLGEYVCSKKNLTNFALSSVRWLIILVCFGIVIKGWVLSAQKYLSEKTSVGFIINETTQFIFPSITFCSGINNAGWNTLTGNNNNNNNNNNHNNTTNNNNNNNKFPEKDMQDLIRNISFARSEFLGLFYFPLNTGKEFAGNDSHWTTTTPDLAAGRCYTFDPPYKTSPGGARGMYFSMNYPQSLKSNWDKRLWLYTSGVFLHDKDKFLYSLVSGEAMPSNVRLVIPELKKEQPNIVTIDYSRMTYLDTKEHPCTDDESYSFTKCFERQFSTRRGCQKPWIYFTDFGIKKCENVSEVNNVMKEEWNQSEWLAVDRAKESGCPRLCTSSNYGLNYNTLGGDDDDSNVLRVQIYFQNFKFQYSEEYLLCDLTCLIGEIGGNFGFFLGGSILTMYDLMYDKLRFTSS